MNAKLKVSLVLLGLLAGGLVVSQLAMGLLIVRGNAGQALPLGISVAKLIKAHQHSGYAAVGISLLYIVTSLVGIVRVREKK